MDILRGRTSSNDNGFSERLRRVLEELDDAMSECQEHAQSYLKNTRRMNVSLRTLEANTSSYGESLERIQDKLKDTHDLCQGTIEIVEPFISEDSKP